MAIRFQCGSCDQPIEIDDQWASKPVACPYCRKTVTAPAESTLLDPAVIPTATALPTPQTEGPEPGVFAPPTSTAVPTPSDGRPNTLAVAALALAVATIALLLVTQAVAAPHMPELQRYIEGATSFEESWQGYMEWMEAQGGQPPLGLIVAGMLQLGGWLCWIGAIVCGIIAVRRLFRRRIALAALILSGLTPIIFCCGSA